MGSMAQINLTFKAGKLIMKVAHPPSLCSACSILAGFSFSDGGSCAVF